MRTEVIEAFDIDGAAENILNLLKEDTTAAARSLSSRNNVFYFDGWDGLGASAVLRAIARRLTPAAAGSSDVQLTGLEFEQVIHIDCSLWESRRALQRAVAQQLGLSAVVMEMFDKQDEEDDFRGVAQDSRTEVEQVTRVMYEHIQKLTRRLLVIFHNGSNEEIDLASCCGFTLSGYSTSKVLWTFQGRFRFKPRVDVDRAMKSAGTTTDVFISATDFYRGRRLQEVKEYRKKLWSYLVRQEADELVSTTHKKIDKGPDTTNFDQAAQAVSKCLSYMLQLCSRGHGCIDYHLTTHGANYWICDGIIIKQQQQLGEGDDQYDDGLWRTADALQREIQLEVDYYHQYVPSSTLTRFVESSPYWASPTYGWFAHEILDDEVIVSNGNMFQSYFSKLSVLKLSGCTFSFPSAPFRCCHNLRFLWLDCCQVIDEISTTTDDDICRCFQRLWVLDVRHTAGCSYVLSAQMLDLMTHLRELNVVGAQNWDIGQLRGRLPNIRKLRVQESRIYCSCSENDLFSETNRMELLEFSGNYTEYSMQSLCGLGVGKSNSSLETVIVHEFYGGRLTKVSFKGCINLKNILLSGQLRILDISCTAVKTLDLAKTEIPEELYLLSCEQLCAIMWPPKDMRGGGMPAKLRIDTTHQSSAEQHARCREPQAEQSSSSQGTSLSSSTTALHDGNQPASEFDWYISVRDARLLVSLKPVYSSSRKIYVEISSTNVATGVSGHQKIVERGRNSLIPALSAQQQKQPARAHLLYADVTVENQQQQGGDESKGDAPAAGTTLCMWPCPGAPRLIPEESCYMHIQDQRGAITVPEFVLDGAMVLHVKDNSSITILPSAGWGPKWDKLDWCVIERCPKLEYAFGTELWRGLTRCSLRTFWASLLTKARYIWKTSELSYTFGCLTYLHVDFCPRVIHAFPSPSSFEWLETLEITWCGDLREVFPPDNSGQPVTLGFPKLKHIHLHELPSLRRICGPGTRMSTPELETLKIRGCWSLKRLMMIVQRAVQLDCEKEWWDGLQWEDDASSQKELYKPTHPKHYKKAALLRGTVLR